MDTTTIKSIKRLGKKQCYNLHMRSSQHNYIIQNGSGQPIHANSHATAYSVISYRSLWLKAHYPAEWWAAAMSDCHRERMIRYMGTARLEGVNFGTIDINHLSRKFAVKDDKITPGLLMIKGVGDSLIAGIDFNAQYTSFDDFMEQHKTKNGGYPSKSLVERLVKLGAFDKLCLNRKLVWSWYLYNYGGTDEARDFRKLANWAHCWTMDEIKQERDRLAREYIKLYPKKSKIPTKILNWLPTIPRRNKTNIAPPTPEEEKLCKQIVLSYDDIANYVDEFKLREILEFEKEYLGFYWHSPMDLFHVEGFTIQEARMCGILECVIQSKEVRQGTNGDYYCMTVTDGVESARVMVWTDTIVNNDEEVFADSTGVKMFVTWSDQFRSFNVRSGYQVVPLQLKDEDAS